MQAYILYIIFYIFILAYIILSIFIIQHAWKYKHLGRAVTAIVAIYAIGSIIVILISQIFMFQFGFDTLIELPFSTVF